MLAPYFDARNIRTNGSIAIVLTSSYYACYGNLFMAIIHLS